MAKGSRNDTPNSSGNADYVQQPALVTQLSTKPMSYGDVLDRYCRGTSPPGAATLKKIEEALKLCSDLAKSRSDICDKGMRELSARKRDVADILREHELAERREEAERLATVQKTAAEKEEEAQTRPPAVGAHGVARQDGMDIDSIVKDEETEMGGQARTTTESVSSRDLSPPSPRQHRPMRAIPQAQTFGEDPTTFDDPTVYHIREMHLDLTEDEKKEILGVTSYPQDDLHDLTPGTPPDRDFSNAKPANQVTSTQFAHYLEPYVRPLAQEDIAFLEERGDRSVPFAIPRRGSKHYLNVWAEEDGTYLLDNGHVPLEKYSTNRVAGNMEAMTDDTAENNAISTGPMLARLLATMLPERRIPTTESGQSNGDFAMNGELEESAEANADEQPRQLPPATQMSESSQSGWKAQAKMDWTTADERVKAELRHIGFLPEDAEPDYDGHHDDEVAARLRYLQDELQRVSVVNGARKARILEVAQERMAQQEWSTIADDLDNQLNQAYQKRHRNISKGKKVLKRPGGPGGGSHAAINGIGNSKPGVGEPIRSLMERRSQWNTVLGPLVDFGRTEIPEGTIFDVESMQRLMANESQSWSEAQEQT